jgi:hypothetical protein
MEKYNFNGASHLEFNQPESRVRPNIAADPSTRNPQIAAILPAYNEGGRIGRLLAVLREVNLIDEIIVVDDGSKDSTCSEAVEAARLDERVTIIQHEHNQGKGAAMFTGSWRTRAPIVLFLDSDLIGLSPGQVQDLILPVANRTADMSIGIFEHGNLVTDLSQKLTPWLSGQRCLRRSLLTQVSSRASAGYGVETAITLAARQGSWRVVSVPLSGVSHPTGEIHRGLLRGAANRLRMYSHILQAAWLAGTPNLQIGKLTPRIRYLSILVTILFAVTLAFNQAQALALFQLEDLSLINLGGIFRILVIDQDTSSIPDLLTAESNDQKLLDLPDLDLPDLNLPELDLSLLELPPLALPLLPEFAVNEPKPELLQSVVLSLDNVQLDERAHRFKIRLTGDPDPDGVYTLVMITSTGEERSFPLNPKKAVRGQRQATAWIELADYDDPFLIGIALEAGTGSQTERSGWTFILFPDMIP